MCHSPICNNQRPFNTSIRLFSLFRPQWLASRHLPPPCPVRLCPTKSTSRHSPMNIHRTSQSIPQRLLPPDGTRRLSTGEAEWSWLALIVGEGKPTAPGSTLSQMLTFACSSGKSVATAESPVETVPRPDATATTPLYRQTRARLVDVVPLKTTANLPSCKRRQVEKGHWHLVAAIRLVPSCPSLPIPRDPLRLEQIRPSAWWTRMRISNNPLERTKQACCLLGSVMSRHCTGHSSWNGLWYLSGGRPAPRRRLTSFWRHRLASRRVEWQSRPPGSLFLSRMDHHTCRGAKFKVSLARHPPTAAPNISTSTQDSNLLAKRLGLLLIRCKPA
jgi:hypothetical protein